MKYGHIIWNIWVILWARFNMPAQFGDFMKMNLLIVERFTQQSIWMRYFPCWRCWQFYWISIAFTVTFVSLESVTLSIIRQRNTGMIDHNCQNEMCLGFLWLVIENWLKNVRFIWDLFSKIVHMLNCLLLSIQCMRSCCLWNLYIGIFVNRSA